MPIAGGTARWLDAFKTHQKADCPSERFRPLSASPTRKLARFHSRLDSLRAILRASRLRAAMSSGTPSKSWSGSILGRRGPFVGFIYRIVVVFAGDVAGKVPLVIFTGFHLSFR